MTSRIRGGKNKISRQRESTKRNNAHIEEQYVEELSTGNNSDDLSAHGNESDHMSAHENETDHPASSQVNYSQNYSQKIVIGVLLV